MATNSLPQPTLDTFQPISTSAVHVLARMAARRAVQEELRSQGVRVSLVKPAEINAKTNEYLRQHPELYREALVRAQLMRCFEKPKRRRALNKDRGGAADLLHDFINQAEIVIHLRGAKKYGRHSITLYRISTFDFRRP